MSRSLPLCPSPMPMPALGRFDPNGAHELVLQLGTQGELRLSANDVRRFQRAFAAFEIEAIRIDGHTNQINLKIQPLGEF